MQTNRGPVNGSNVISTNVIRHSSYPRTKMNQILNKDILQNKQKYFVILSPFLIIAINFLVAVLFGKILGKWAFIPVILIEWCIFLFLIIKFGGLDSIKRWLKKPSGSNVWAVLALLMGEIGRAHV